LLYMGRMHEVVELTLMPVGDLGLRQLMMNFVPGRNRSALSSMLRAHLADREVTFHRKWGRFL